MQARGRCGIVGLFVAVSGLPTAALGDSGKPPCSRRGAVTVVENGEVRVYAVRSSNSIYACDRHTARTVVLGPSPSPAACGEGQVCQVGKFSLTAGFVSYARFRGPLIGPPVQTSIRVRDVRRASARTLSAYSIDELRAPAGQAVRVNVRVNSRGGVGWIVRNSYARAGPRYEVHRGDRRGGRLVAVGSYIDPNSLRVTRSSLSWRQAGRRLTVNLWGFG